MKSSVDSKAMTFTDTDIRTVAPRFPLVRPDAIRLLRLNQVMDRTGLKKTKLYEMQSTGDFPMRIQVAAHAVAFLE